MTGHGHILMILVFAAIVVVVVAVLLLRRPERSASPYINKPIMTAHEAVFFPKLCHAAERVGAAHVFPQVAMSGIIDVAPYIDEQRSRALRNKFCQKRIDFVVADEGYNVMMIVELDDSSHDSNFAIAKDRDRDAITRAAGYTTIRLRQGRRITVDEIERQIRKAIAA